MESSQDAQDEPMDVPLAGNDTPSRNFRSALLQGDDWWSIWLGWFLLLFVLAVVWVSRPADNAQRVEAYQSLTKQLEQLKSDSSPDRQEIKSLRKQQGELKAELATNPLKPWVAKPDSWDNNPLDAFTGKSNQNLLWGICGVFCCAIILFSVAVVIMGQGGIRQQALPFSFAFLMLFLLATLAYLLAGQKVVKHYNLEYALWALVVGLIISNTIKTPLFMLPAVRTEFYIKTGLVLLGAEVLFNRLLLLGMPGVCIAWVVTPIVLISTYLFGQYVLKIPSKSLNMVISADMSVCGVSAAIATAAACRAKKEELSLAIGMSLSFTVIMMVVMPAVIQALNLGPVLGGAWMGGTIDSTGAVAAAGGMLGETALTVAATIKMIQNILIGFVAFGVAVYWVTCVDRDSEGSRPSLREVWIRFPKFVIGFVAASILFSLIATSGVEGDAITTAVISTTKTFRGWFFCLAFVSIGLETNFRKLATFFVGGKPLILYGCGQCLNLLLTLAMAWLMFEKVFPNAATALGN